MIGYKFEKGSGALYYGMMDAPTSSIARYQSPRRKAPKVSNHVMCHIRFSSEMEIEGGPPVVARCEALEYDTDNLDGRELPRAGRVLAQWHQGCGRTYQQWVRAVVDAQRERLLIEGTITETYKERYRRLARAEDR